MREVGSAISLDPTILSRLECDGRMPTKEQVLLLAEFYQDQKNELIIAWLSDKLVNEVHEEKLALQAIRMAEEKIKYLKMERKVKNDN